MPALMISITARALLLVWAHGNMGQMQSWSRLDRLERVEPVAMHRSHRTRLETCRLLAAPILLTA